jgi:Fe-S cluster biogenesis protein NfuA
MSMSSAPRPIHVERTADPTVLCWVVHHPKLDLSPPGRRLAPAASPLGQLGADRSITDIAVRNGNVMVSTDDPESWSQLAPRIQAALLDELELLDDAESHWLLGAVEIAGRALSIAELQQVVDRAAGTVMSSHGGGMVVVAIDGDAVRLRSDGVCTGCRHSDDTILGLISPALRTAYPEIASVSVDHAETYH